MTTITEIPSGYVSNLTPSQEEKLREFWRIVMQSWDTNIPCPDPVSNASAVSNGTAKSHRRFFSLSRSQTQPAEEETAAIPPKLLSTLKSLGAGTNEMKTVHSLFTKLPGDQLRSAFLTILKQDHPDAFLLRFLRAEKWNVPKAWIKFVSALNWRVNEYKVDEEVLPKGEEYALRTSRSTNDSAEKKDSEGFVLQLQTGKGHFHGTDKWGRPICIVRVRYHDPSAQTQKGLNDFIIHCIETVRLMQVPPVEAMTIVFDLTSFTLANWDFPPIKFIIESFQENYPESLGAMIFYNAPWVFSGLWKLIHGILDPVVAAKVHFINGADNLQQLIPQARIIKELGGEENWEYEYIEPKPHENDRLQDTATRNAILTDRKTLGHDLFRVTTEWISNPQDETLKSRRCEVINHLRDNYWELDPYVRSRTILDRTGVIQGGGKVDFYPTVECQLETNEEPKEMVEHVDTTRLMTVVS